jgi:hypothetical protein
MSEQHHPSERPRRRAAEWLRHRREPVDRPRLVQHLFSPADPEDALARRTLRAETERELDAQNAKLVAVEAEVRALKELLRSRTAEDAGQLPPEPEPQPEEHLLFVPGPQGYALVPGHGAAPPVGRAVRLGDRDGVFVVAKVASSPYPGDRRRCAYLEAPAASPTG